MKRIVLTLAFALACTCAFTFAADEGTRHIVGDDVDMFFMNDKVFGTVAGHPLWSTLR